MQAFDTDMVWEQDFLLQAIADRPEWATVDVGDATEAIVDDEHGGVVALAIAATNEAEDAVLYLEDDLMFDIDKLKTVDFRAKAITPGTGVTVVFGMAGAHNLDKDTIAQNAWFRLQASLALLVETDDGTNDNDDGATGVTLTTDTWYWFRIDFTNSANVKFLYRTDAANAWTDLTATALAALGKTAFDMSKYTAGLQPYMSLDKASGTGTGTLKVDKITVRCGR